MNKNFKPTYIVDLANNNVTDLESLTLATVSGKIDAIGITNDEIAALVNNVIAKIINNNDAEALVVDKDGNALTVTSKMIEDGIEAINQIFKKKEPWYKRLWHKIFPKKSK